MFAATARQHCTQSRSRSKHNTHPSSPAHAFKPGCKARHSRWVSAAHSSFAPPTLHKCNIASSVGRHLVRCPCHGQRRTGLAPLIHLSPPRGQGYGQKFGFPVPTGTPTLCWRRRRCPSPPTRNRARVSTGAVHLMTASRGGRPPRIRGHTLGAPTHIHRPSPKGFRSASARKDDRGQVIWAHFSAEQLCTRSARARARARRCTH